MSKVAPIVEETKELPPLFEPFKWHREEVFQPNVKLPAYTIIRFLGHTQDVASGVATIIEINTRDDAEKESSANPQVLLSPNDHWQLSRLSIAALKMLSDNAHELTEWAYKNHTPEGRAENGGDNYD